MLVTMMMVMRTPAYEEVFLNLVMLDVDGAGSGFLSNLLNDRIQHFYRIFH